MKITSTRSHILRGRGPSLAAAVTITLLLLASFLSGRFELWMKFGDLPWRELPMANGWNGFSVNTIQLLSQVPATFTVYSYGANAMGDPIDSVTINACGESS